MFNYEYEELLDTVLRCGDLKGDRTGTGTISTFGEQMVFNLAKGFPLITTKRVHLKSVVAELLWFLSGSSNITELQQQGVKIWDSWADQDGNLGPVYGSQWRSWPTPDGGSIDQISRALHLIRTTPDSRRIIVSAWNVAMLEEMALEPCHVLFQFYVSNGKLSCQLYQRSADMFLGVPFNIASYALLTHMMAQQADLEVGDLIWVGGDCHIYNNHIEQVEEQLSREVFEFPTLKLNKAKSLFDYAPEDIEILDYQHHPAIKAPVAV